MNKATQVLWRALRCFAATLSLDPIGAMALLQDHAGVKRGC